MASKAEKIKQDISEIEKRSGELAAELLEVRSKLEPAKLKASAALVDGGKTWDNSSAEVERLQIRVNIIMGAAEELERRIEEKRSELHEAERDEAQKHITEISQAGAGEALALLDEVLICGSKAQDLLERINETRALQLKYKLSGDGGLSSMEGNLRDVAEFARVQYQRIQFIDSVSRGKSVYSELLEEMRNRGSVEGNYLARRVISSSRE